MLNAVYIVTDPGLLQKLQVGSVISRLPRVSQFLGRSCFYIKKGLINCLIVQKVNVSMACVNKNISL